MNRHKSQSIRVAALLFAVLCTAQAAVVAGPPESFRDSVWTWGYVIPDKVPGPVPFVFPGNASCSIETAAAYFGTPNVVLMNYDWSKPGRLERLTACKRVLCAIPMSKAAGVAAELSALSKKHPNIVGAMIDDFFVAENKLPVDDLKATYTALKSKNPAIKLYVVRYTNSKDDQLAPYLPYFDVINLWAGTDKKEEWTTMGERVEKLSRATHKPVVMGLYLHNYQTPRPDNWREMAPWSWTPPMPMDLLQLQQLKTTELLCEGKIDGFILLQSGWLGRETHRLQMQWTKEYLEWLFQTQTKPHLGGSY